MRKPQQGQNDQSTCDIATLQEEKHSSWREHDLYCSKERIIIKHSLHYR